jgi:inosine/xanthosine triphosphate pyrophosphatase family protein
MMELIVRKFECDTHGEFQDTIYRWDEVTGMFQPDLPADLRALSRTIEDIIFLTGNQNKLRELEAGLQLRNITLSCPSEKIDLAEIQDSSILNIIQDKCRRACDRIRECHSAGPDDDSRSRIILVEDTCLNFEALNGMPGPYVKCKFTNPVSDANNYSTVRI